jgi:RimJ/RimL family protein N-acetyltransferase
MGYRRRGLAKEAEILTLDCCFNHLGMHKVIAHALITSDLHRGAAGIS